jgi:hypothetical protein
MELDLIEGNTLFLDGSKVQAYAWIKNTWAKATCKNPLKVLTLE